MPLSNSLPTEVAMNGLTSLLSHTLSQMSVSQKHNHSISKFNCIGGVYQQTILSGGDDILDASKFGSNDWLGTGDSLQCGDAEWLEN